MGSVRVVLDSGGISRTMKGEQVRRVLLRKAQGLADEMEPAFMAHHHGTPTHRLLGARANVASYTAIGQVFTKGTAALNIERKYGILKSRAD